MARALLKQASAKRFRALEPSPPSESSAIWPSFGPYPNLRIIFCANARHGSFNAEHAAIIRAPRLVPQAPPLLAQFYPRSVTLRNILVLLAFYSPVEKLTWSIHTFTSICQVAETLPLLNSDHTKIGHNIPFPRLRHAYHHSKTPSTPQTYTSTVTYSKTGHGILRLRVIIACRRC